MFNGNEKLSIFLEWLTWLVLALVAYNITYEFDKPLEGYRYGATGWVRFVLISIVFGATLQAIFKHFRWEEVEADEEDQADTLETESSWRRRIRSISIFVVPLIYLWLVPRTGFYLTTPFFIAIYMVVLHVKGWKPFIIVPSIVYGLILLIFTRLFYVALPVGSWQAFYDINNAIIVTVRSGL